MAKWAHISKAPFERAYDKVIASAPPYEEIGKRKAWAPDRKHYATAGFQFSEDKFDVFVAIFKRGPVEVDRRVFFTAFPSIWVAPSHVVGLEWRDSAIEMLCKPRNRWRQATFNRMLTGRRLRPNDVFRAIQINYCLNGQLTLSRLAQSPQLRKV